MLFLEILFMEVTLLGDLLNLMLLHNILSGKPKRKVVIVNPVTQQQSIITPLDYNILQCQHQELQ